jgi:hypothetical protein
MQVECHLYVSEMAAWEDEDVFVVFVKFVLPSRANVSSRA